jgi:Tol biopolymer transport system component
MRIRFVSLLVALTVAATFTVLGQSQTAETMLEAARKLEVVDGDLKAAIEAYQQITARPGVSREFAATALVRMAECYDKLGDGGARTIYERIVREYADQQPAVATARARLATSKPSTVATGMVHRKVWAGPEVSAESSVSADGRFVSYPAWDTGDLGLRDLVTGQNRLLTNNGYARNEYAQGSALSRDGRQVAYAWYNGTDRYELRVVSTQSAGPGEPRKLYDNEDVDFLIPFDWSPDGRSVAVWLSRKDRASQIGLVSVPDGSLQVLKSLDWRGPTRMSLSPDGRHLGFDLPMSDADANERDVFVLAVDGSRERHVVAGPGQDRFMGWSPDGRTLLFASDRTGALGLWSVPIRDGQAQDGPRLIKADIPAETIGITKSGALYTIAVTGSIDVHTASVDFSTGALVTPSRTVVQSFVGYNGGPDWSPDGSSLAYVSRRGPGGRDRVIVIRSLETGRNRDLAVAMSYAPVVRWAPDGRSFVIKGRAPNGREGVFRVDAQTGALTELVRVPGESGNSQAAMSPDGRKLYFWSGNVLRGTPGSRFLERDLASGQERVLFGAGGPIYPDLSPDGRYLAGVVDDKDRKPVAVVLIPVAGGDGKELFRVRDAETLSRYIAWTPDGRGVVVPIRAEGGFAPLFVPVSGETPRKLDLEVSLTGVRVHPDGRQIAFATTDSREWELWVLENFLPALTAAQVHPIVPSFASAINLEETSENSANVSVGDLDGDGDLDLVVAKGRHTPLVDRVLLNDGRGAFSATDLSPIADRTYSAVLADVDRDGDLDILVSNDAPDRKVVYLNDGKAHFRLAGTWGASEWPTRNAAAADLNGDGWPDVIAANRPGPSFVCLNDRHGGFPTPCSAIQIGSATSVAPADFNNDGLIDLAVPYRDDGQSLIFMNDGHANFVRTVPFGPPDATARVAAAADFNGDGWQDLVVGDEGKASMVVYLNDGQGGLSPGFEVTNKTRVPYAIAAGDLNGDARPDIVIGYINAPSAVFFNDRSGRFFNELRFGDEKGVAYGFALGDLNGDRHPDITLARSGAPNVMFISKK